MTTENNAGEWTETGYRAASTNAPGNSTGIQGHGANIFGNNRTTNEHGAPVSRDFIEHQQREQAKAISDSFLDPETQTPVVMNGIIAENAPHEWISQYGWHAVGATGPCHPSARQARGLVAAYLSAMSRSPDGQVTESISFTDNSLHPSVATVRLGVGRIRTS